MDSISSLAAKLRPYWLRDAIGNTYVTNNYTTTTGGGGGGGGVDLSWVVPETRLVIAGDGMTGGGDLSADRTFSVNSTVVRTTRSVIAGNGLTGGGTLAADRTFTVGAGNGIAVGTTSVSVNLATNPGLTVGVGGLALGAPTAVSATTTNTVSGSGHTHDVTWLSTTGATTTLLGVTLGVFGVVQGTFSTKVNTPLIDAPNALRLQPTNALELNPGNHLVTLMPDKFLQSSNYASQTTGMRVSYLGEGDFRYIYTDELHAKAFIADLEQALAGGQIISKSVAILDVDFTAPAAGGTAWLYVKSLPSAGGMDVFEAGDYIRIRNFSRAGGGLSITDCWGTVRKLAGEPLYGTNPDTGEENQRWHFTRSLAPNAGAMGTGNVVEAGAIILDYGVAGNGYYEVNAIDGIYALDSPYMQIVTFSGHPHSTKSTRVRVGNLRGIFGVTDEYGLFAGVDTASTSAYLRLTNLAAVFNNIPVTMQASGLVTGSWSSNGQLDIGFGPNGTSVINERDFTVHATGYVRIGWLLDGANPMPNLFWSKTSGYLSLRSGGTQVITFDTLGNSYFSGRMTIGTSGEIIQGTGTPGTASEGGSPWGTFNGIRITNIGGMGYFATYGGGVLQTATDTTGKFTFGAGAGTLSAAGLNLTANTGAVSTSDPKAVQWWSGATFIGSITGVYDPPFIVPELVIRVGTTETFFSQGHASTFGSFYALGSIETDGGLDVDNDAVIGGTLGVTGAITTAIGGAGSGYGFTGGNTSIYGTATGFAIEQGGTDIWRSTTSNADSYIRLGYNNANNRNTIVDFHSNGSAPTTLSARLVRAATANGAFQLINTGTGALDIIRFNQNGVELARFHTDGRFGIGTTSPETLLDVEGYARAVSFIIDGDGGAASSSGGLVALTKTVTAGATVSVWTGFLRVYINGSTYRIPYVT
jgi:hypothetical protein